MRRISLIAGLLFVAVAAASSSYAQSGISSMRDAWNLAVTSARQGDVEGAEAALVQVESSQQALGIERLPRYATSLAALALEAESDGDRALADWAIEAAVRLDPDNPSVAASRTDLVQMRGGIGAAVGLIPGAVGKILGDEASANLAGADFRISLGVAVLLLVFGLGLVLLIKYHRVLLHDGREFLSGKVGPGAATTFAFAFLFLPLLLWLSPLWLGPWWLLLSFRYATAREKVAVAVTLLLGAVSPWLFASAAHEITAGQLAVVRGVETSVTNSYDPEVAARVSELLASMPDSPELNLLVGNLALIEGDDNEAMRRYQRAVDLEESYAGAHLNVGNVHFLQEDQAAATFRYERAAELDPDLIEAFINNSIVAGESFDFPKQTRLIDEAKAINRSRADELLEIGTPIRQVHFYQLSNEEIERVGTQIAASESGASDLFGNYTPIDASSALTHPYAIGSIGLLILALILSRVRSRTARACVKCGRTFCHRCKSSKDSATYCTQCIHIYIKRDGVLADARKRKMEEVSDYLRRSASRTKWLSLVMPGSAQVMRNGVEIGLIVMFVFFLGVTFALLSGRLAPVVSPAEALQAALRYVGIGLALLMWLVFTLPALFSKAEAS